MVTRLGGEPPPPDMLLAHETAILDKETARYQDERRGLLIGGMLLSFTGWHAFAYNCHKCATGHALLLGWAGVLALQGNSPSAVAVLIGATMYGWLTLIVALAVCCQRYEKEIWRLAGEIAIARELAYGPWDGTTIDGVVWEQPKPKLPPARLTVYSDATRH